MLRGASTFSISGNKGAVATFSNSYCVTRCGTGTSADTDQIISIKRATSTDLGGLVARVADANNWYAITLGEYANNLAFSKFVGGTYTSGIVFGPNTTFALGTTYNVRFRCIGTSIRARAWDASTAEPSTWDIDTTDTSLSGASGFGVIADPATNTAMTFDDYVATDGSTTTTSTRTVPATAALLATSQRSVPASAALLAPSSRTVSATAALSETQTRTVPASAALQLTSSRTIPESAALLQTGTRVVPASAALLATLARTIPCTAALSGVSVAPPTNATFYVRGGEATFYVRKGNATFYVRE